MSVASDPTLLWTARLLLVGVLGAAAFSKFQARQEFAGVVQNYRLLPGFLVTPVAALIPWIEGIVAVGLVLEPTRFPAAAGALGLLLAFTGAIVVNLLRGRTEIDCGCFAAVLRQRLSWGLVVRNGVLVVIALLVLAPVSPERAMGWFDWMTAGMATVVLMLLYTALSYLLGRELPQQPEVEISL